MLIGMATDTKQHQAAKAFVKDWLGKGHEKGETARFWMNLLGRVFGRTYLPLENWPKIQFVGNSGKLPQTGKITR